MRKFSLLIILFVIAAAASGITNPNQQYNFFSFSESKKLITHELDSLTPAKFKSHPDYGTLPYNAPCKDCIELQDQRDATTRYFTESGSKGKSFYKQHSYGAINYKDESGWWREINYRLKRKDGNIFEAPDQPSPVLINLDKNFSSIKNLGKEIRFNKNLELYHLDENGKTQSLGTPDWSHYSAGDDGILITEFYPGIDLQLIAFEGRLKTNFVLRHQLSFNSGWIVMKEQIELPDGLAFNFSETRKDENKKLFGEIAIDGTDNEFFRIHPSVAFDGDEIPHLIQLGCEIRNENELLTYIPTNWLNDTRTVYPVVIDPTLSASASLSQASISGSQYSATCWTGGCLYNLSFASPPNSTIADVTFSFSYSTIAPCTFPDGGISIDFGACRSPSSGAHTCGPGSGTCSILNSSIMNDFRSCIPPPQCAPYMMDFTMHFYRCNNDPTPGCNSNCIVAASAWTMTVVGKTLELDSVNADQLICEGDSATIAVYPTNGAPAYSYLWNPTGSTNNSITVSPSSTTVYQVQVTDNCLVTINDSVTVNVIPNNNPGFTITPNPECTGQNITLNGLGAAPATNYDWLIPGSNHSVMNDTQSPVVQYPIQGSYNVTLNYRNGTCIFPSQQTINISNSVTPAVSISSNPSTTGAICSGTNVVFTANPTNGGVTPSYQWQVNGVNAGANSDTFSVSLNSTSAVSVTMTSNLPCVTTPTANSVTFVDVTPAVTPSVNISSNPPPPVCSGTPVLFTAAPTSGGSTPSFQWQINSVNVGADADTFSTASLVNGDLIAVRLTSSFNCASPATADDTMTVAVFPPASPSVTISTNPGTSFCSGTPVTFTANPVNGGSAPTYTWYRNNVLMGAGVTYSSSTLNNDDTIKVIMASNLSCVTPVTATAQVLVTVATTVSPSVSVTANPAGVVCAGTPIHFTALPVNGGSAPSYQWILNSIPVSSSVDTFTISSPTNGDIIKVIMTPNLNCLTSATASDSLTITVSPSATPSVTVTVAPNDTACAGDNLIFTASPQNQGTTPVYQWFVNGVGVGTNSSTYSSSALNDGDNVNVSMTSNAACVLPVNVSSLPVTVTLNPLLTPSVNIVALPTGIICTGATVQFTAAPINGGTAPSYQWTVDANNAGGNSSSFSSSALIQGNIVSVTMTSNENCLAQPSANSNTIAISTYPPVTLIASGAAVICPKEAVTLHAFASAGDGGPYHYSWNNGAGNDGSATVAPATSTNYIVSATDNCGTPPVTASVFVSVTPGPSSMYSYNPADPSSYYPEISFSNLSSADAVSWRWNFGDGDSSSLQNPVHLFPAAGTYSVSLVATGMNGCTDTITYSIFVKEEVALYVPNSFTPNGDGWNDTFGPMGNNVGNFEMTIFDRWGNEIFNGGPKNPWDGSIKGSGNKAPMGVYLYRIDLNDSRFDKQILTGGVTLIR